MFIRYFICIADPVAKLLSVGFVLTLGYLENGFKSVTDSPFCLKSIKYNQTSTLSHHLL